MPPGSSGFTRPVKANRFITGMIGGRTFMAHNLDKHVEDAATFLAGKVRQGIVNQKPGGKSLRPLRPSTLRQKKPKTKALINDADLLRSIKGYRIKNRKYLVGVHRTVRRKGKKVANIAAVLELGSKDGHIDPLPYLQPTFEKHKQELVQRVGNGVTNAFFAGIGVPV